MREVLLIGRGGLRILAMAGWLPVLQMPVVDRPARRYQPGGALDYSGLRFVEYDSVDDWTFIEVVNERTDWTV